MWFWSCLPSGSQCNGTAQLCTRPLKYTLAFSPIDLAKGRTFSGVVDATAQAATVDSHCRETVGTLLESESMVEEEEKRAGCPAFGSVFISSRPSLPRFQSPNF